MRDPRWDVVLPAAASVAAAVMLLLALLTADVLRARDLLVLEGHLLGLAHSVEGALRDEGADAAPQVLAELLAEHAPVVRHLRLLDAHGGEIATAGRPAPELPLREVELFVGPHGRPGIVRAPGPGPRRGRGRFLLAARLDPAAAGSPLLALVVPVATGLAGIALILLALLAGRLLRRQRSLAAEEAQRRRLEVLGRAGAGLAHQLRTPLATLKGSCQLLAERTADAAAAHRLQVAVREAERMEALLTRLLDFARPPAAERSSFTLPPLLEEIAESRRDRLVLRVPAGLAVSADREHLRLILDNLLDNAAAASPAGEPVELAAERAGPAVRIVIADRGPGPGEAPEELFEPYLTRRADGAGLGLPIARALAEANGGSLVLRARDGGGAEAVLELPAAPETP